DSKPTLGETSPAKIETLSKSVVKVGEGRGFVVAYRQKLPPYDGKQVSYEMRLIITAAHCLPRIPQHLFDDAPYTNLLGTLDASRRKVWAECLFVDPVADIAILVEPDAQRFCTVKDFDADAYQELVSACHPLRIGSPRPVAERVWLMGLDGKWFS